MGGIDARTMEKPRRFFGRRRNAEDWRLAHDHRHRPRRHGLANGRGHLRGVQGNREHEIVLDRGLFERRIFPAINIPQTGTRKEEKLLRPDLLPKIHKLRRALSSVKPQDAMELLLSKLAKTKTNKEFLKSIL